jgi:hypothetical protein
VLEPVLYYSSLNGMLELDFGDGRSLNRAIKGILQTGVFTCRADIPSGPAMAGCSPEAVRLGFRVAVRAIGLTSFDHFAALKHLLDL